MKINQKLTDLICDLEKIIGSECYNGNSYNGYTDEYGASFRYPVWYQNNELKIECKTRYKIEKIESSDIEKIYYKFGSNELNIGRGLIRVLAELEKRYGVDFSK